MKLYTVNYQDENDNTIVEWFGTQAEHKTRKKALIALGFVPHDKVVDFPLDKSNLIGFLNRYVTENIDDLLYILPPYVSKGRKETTA